MSMGPRAARQHRLLARAATKYLQSLESSPGLVIAPGFGFRITAVITLTAGTLFLMWLGEQITERGLGNGISILIFGGIAAGLPNAIGGLLEPEQVRACAAAG